MKWRPIMEFPKYEISEDKDIRNAKTKRLIKVGTDGRVNLYSETGTRISRTVEVLYRTIFPEYTEAKEAKMLYAAEDTRLIPDLEPHRYEAIKSLAARIVNNGHTEFVSSAGVFQALWNQEALPSSNRIIHHGMTYEDLLQEAIVYAYTVIYELHSESPVPTSYISTAMYNHFISMYGENNALDKAQSLDYEDETGETVSMLDTYVPEPDDMDFGVSDSMLEKLEWMRSKLNRQDYEIIYYYYGYELTMEEIAKKVGLSRQTVSGRIKHIMAKLQREISKAH